MTKRTPLQNLVDERGITQQKLAETADMATAQLHRAYHGQVPSGRNQFRIVRALAELGITTTRDELWPEVEG